MSAAVAAAAAGAPAAAAAGGAPGAPGAPAAAQGWSLSSLFRMLMFYWMVSSFFKGSAPAKEVKDVSTGVMHYPHRNAWPEHTPYSLYVFVHDREELNVNVHTAATLNPRSLIWFENNLKYGWDPLASEAALNWTMGSDSWPLHHLQANGTLYAHTFFVKDHTPLFQWRAVGDVAGEDAYTNTHDAVVPSSSSSAVSAGKDGAAPDLLTLPSDTTTPEFTARFLRNPSFVPGNIVHRVMSLNVYRPAPKKVDKKNLLGVGTAEGKANASKELEIKPVEVAEAAAEESEEDDAEFLDFETDDDEFSGSTGKRVAKATSKSNKGPASAPWVSYWKPFLTIRLIPDWTVFPYGGIPAEMVSDYVINPRNDAYDPPIYFDYFWLLKDQLVAVNSSVSELSLNLTHCPLSLMKWRLETQMETSWKMQQSWGMQEDDGRDSEMFKKLVMDTNVYLLALTFFVSILHMVFDFLAFKNDVAFWKDTKSMRGLSTRTILVNMVTQSIIFLYLCDNDTSYMILLSSGVGIVIEGWKASKAFVFKWDASKPLRQRLRILNKAMSEEKAEDEKTEEEKEMELHASYDAEAMRYLSYALYPFVVCYAIYSLWYEDHKSWYSFVLAVLTGCVYTGGFISQCKTNRVD